MESPPFRPRGSGSSASAISASAPVFQIAQSPLPSTAGGTPSHHHPLKYAGRSSPTLGEGVYSNAVRSYSFQTSPNGYVYPIKIIDDISYFCQIHLASSMDIILSI